MKKINSRAKPSALSQEIHGVFQEFEAFLQVLEVLVKESAKREGIELKSKRQRTSGRLG